MLTWQQYVLFFFKWQIFHHAVFALGVFLWRQNVFRRACFRVSWGKVVALSRAFYMFEGKTLQGKISWIEVGGWDLNDFNTVFEIKFRIRETPHPLITQLIWVWQSPATHILLTAHWTWQVKQVRLSGESKNGKRTISGSQKHLDIGGYKEDSFVHIAAF